MKNWLILIFFVRALFSQWAYSFIRAIIPTYYRQALNESEEGAANLQLLFSLGMAFGRPIMGLISDKLGVTLTAIVCESIALLSYYALWLPAKSFPMIGIHSLLQGSLGGVFFLTALPITKRIATPKDVRSIITVIWLVSALASMLSLYSSLLIVDRAESDGIDTLNSYRIIIYFNSAFIGVAILLSAVLHTKIRRDEKSRNPEDSCNKTKIEHDVLSIAG